MSECPPLFAQPCRFIAGAGSIDSLPEITYPEIAFIGRSNVGKSSLVNALVGRNALARTSQHPGHTRQLNFFLLDERLMLVDMPGYGYAKVSKTQKSEWDRLIHGYLTGRPNLQRACLLIDARRGVMPSDEEFMTMLDEAAVTFQIIITKADSLGARELAANVAAIEAIARSHPAAHPQSIVTSAREKQGMAALQEQLTPFAQ